MSSDKDEKPAAVVTQMTFAASPTQAWDGMASTATEVYTSPLGSPADSYA